MKLVSHKNYPCPKKLLDSSQQDRTGVYRGIRTTFSHPARICRDRTMLTYRGVCYMVGNEIQPSNSIDADPCLLTYRGVSYCSSQNIQRA